VLSGNICYFNTVSNAEDKKTYMYSEVGMKEPLRGTTRESQGVRFSKEPSINFSETDMK